jgi:hypothetical protein
MFRRDWRKNLQRLPDLRFQLAEERTRQHSDSSERGRYAFEHTKSRLPDLRTGYSQQRSDDLRFQFEQERIAQYSDSGRQDRRQPDLRLGNFQDPLGDLRMQLQLERSASCHGKSETHPYSRKRRYEYEVAEEERQQKKPRTYGFSSARYNSQSAVTKQKNAAPQNNIIEIILAHLSESDNSYDGALLKRLADCTTFAEFCLSLQALPPRSCNVRGLQHILRPLCKLNYKEFKNLFYVLRDEGYLNKNLVKLYVFQAICDHRDYEFVKKILTPVNGKPLYFSSADPFQIALQALLNKENIHDDSLLIAKELIDLAILSNLVNSLMFYYALQLCKKHNAFAMGSQIFQQALEVKKIAPNGLLIFMDLAISINQYDSAIQAYDAVHLGKLFEYNPYSVQNDEKYKGDLAVRYMQALRIKRDFAKAENLFYETCNRNIAISQHCKIRISSNYLCLCIKLKEFAALDKGLQHLIKEDCVDVHSFNIYIGAYFRSLEMREKTEDAFRCAEEKGLFDKNTFHFMILSSIEADDIHKMMSYWEKAIQSRMEMSVIVAKQSLNKLIQEKNQQSLQDAKLIFNYINHYAPRDMFLYSLMMKKARKAQDFAYVIRIFNNLSRNQHITDSYVIFEYLNALNRVRHFETIIDYYQRNKAQFNFFHETLLLAISIMYSAMQKGNIVLAKALVTKAKESKPTQENIDHINRMENWLLLTAVNANHKDEIEEIFKGIAKKTKIGYVGFMLFLLRENRLTEIPNIFREAAENNCLSAMLYTSYLVYLTSKQDNKGVIDFLNEAEQAGFLSLEFIVVFMLNMRDKEDASHVKRALALASQHEILHAKHIEICMHFCEQHQLEKLRSWAKSLTVKQPLLHKSIKELEALVNRLFSVKALSESVGQSASENQSLIALSDKEHAFTKSEKDIDLFNFLNSLIQEDSPFSQENLELELPQKFAEQQVQSINLNLSLDKVVDEEWNSNRFFENALVEQGNNPTSCLEQAVTTSPLVEDLHLISEPVLSKEELLTSPRPDSLFTSGDQVLLGQGPTDSSIDLRLAGDDNDSSDIGKELGCDKSVSTDPRFFSSSSNIPLKLRFKLGVKTDCAPSENCNSKTTTTNEIESTQTKMSLEIPGPNEPHPDQRFFSGSLLSSPSSPSSNDSEPEKENIIVTSRKAPRSFMWPNRGNKAPRNSSTILPREEIASATLKEFHQFALRHKELSDHEIAFKFYSSKGLNPEDRNTAALYIKQFFLDEAQVLSDDLPKALSINFFKTNNVSKIRRYFNENYESKLLPILPLPDKAYLGEISKEYGFKDS